MVRTTKDCLALQDAGEPVLKAIINTGEDTRKKLSAMIWLNIAALNSFLHLNNPLGDAEIDFIAEQIIDEFGGALTMADIYLVLRNAKAGKYGKLYERLSAPDVLGWFREYYNSRLDAAYEYNLNKDKKRFSGANDGDMVLESIGYKFVDGRISYDTEKLFQNDQKRKEQSSITDEEYQRYKAELIKNNYKINKP